MENTFTSGPYEVDKDEQGFYQIRQAEDKGILAYRINRKENAVLFSLAPEMLEALENALPYIRNDINGDMGAQEEDRDFLSSIEALIKKAKG